MIDWASSYSCEWRLFRVDERTWADAELVDGLVSASVRTDCSGTAPELVSGSLSVRGESWEPGHYRLSVAARQDGQTERADICTLLCERSGTGREISKTMAVSGLGVLHPASTVQVALGSHVRKGDDGAEAVARLLMGSVRAPVSVEGAFTLDEHFVFTPGQSVLEAAWGLLEAAGFCIQVWGDGTVHILPRPTEPALSLEWANAKLLLPRISSSLGISDAKNRYVAVEGGYQEVAENYDQGIGSYASRGYWNSEYDDSPVRINGETLATYASRMLKKLSVAENSYSYERRFIPGVSPFDLVRSSQSTLGTDSDLRVQSQQIECGTGIKVSETSVEEVQTWAA